MYGNFKFQTIDQSDCVDDAFHCTRWTYVDSLIIILNSSWICQVHIERPFGTREFCSLFSLHKRANRRFLRSIILFIVSIAICSNIWCCHIYMFICVWWFFFNALLAYSKCTILNNASGVCRWCNCSIKPLIFRFYVSLNRDQHAFPYSA